MDRRSTNGALRLGCFFAQLAVGARLATSEVCRRLGMDASMLEELAGHWTDASIASLYYSNFLENRSMLSLQAVAYLALSGRTAGNFRSVNSLVDHSIIALRQLRLHLDVDAVPAPTVAPATEWETKASREIRKRVCWALCICHCHLAGRGERRTTERVRALPPGASAVLDVLCAAWTLARRSGTATWPTLLLSPTSTFSSTSPESSTKPASRRNSRRISSQHNEQHWFDCSSRQIKPLPILPSCAPSLASRPRTGSCASFAYRPILGPRKRSKPHGSCCARCRPYKSTKGTIG
ncbi:hypothetical protein AAT19DRAFT_15281 [Rhodotorula toruloides]|uniref:Transcription factor domain-containing protein n=1 Tax=Rhodotorula toruloides TaxID=5286 RepID=A0A2T0A6R3_RHOTO|nr:hypothetical protein AAT19DRAFT_15281 [Rhodotorula toruloides]